LINQKKISFNGHDNYHDAFKKLYYHLYTNSSSSRADKITDDLSKLLLAKLALDRSESAPTIEEVNNDPLSHISKLLKSNFPSFSGVNDKFNIGEDSVRESFRLLSEIDLAKAPAHILGEAFQALIGPRLRGDRGQFFTPRSVVNCMVRILAPENGSIIIDPACGTGGFLAETVSYFSKKNGSNRSKESYEIVGVDKDSDLTKLAESTLEVLSPSKYKIFNNDSLDLEGIWKSEGKYIGNSDYILTNPPFGSKIGVKNKNILDQYELGYNWVYSNSEQRWIKTKKIRSSQDPQILFIELCLRLLKPSGKIGIVLPEGVFGNSRSGYVWDYIRSKSKIWALIDCPRTTFQPGTDTKTNILFLQKNKFENQGGNTNQKVPISVALNCGHDKRGRKTLQNGDPFPDDFEKIATEFRDLDNSKFWSYQKIDDPYYIIPRFYDGTLEEKIKDKCEELNGQVIKFEELIKKKYITVRKGHEVGSNAYGTGDIPFIRTSDIINWEVSADPTKCISEEVYRKYKNKQKIKAGDILLVMDGRYRIGKTAIISKFNTKCVIQSHLKIITVTEKSPINSFELLYIMNMDIMLQQMRNLTYVRSTLGNIGKRLNDLKVIIPDKNDQWNKKIQKFQHLLESRAEILSQLEEFHTPEPEL
jgi:type I restriction enzyme M protein